MYIFIFVVAVVVVVVVVFVVAQLLTCFHSHQAGYLTVEIVTRDWNYWPVFPHTSPGS